jgi:hypothetical protein
MGSLARPSAHFHSTNRDVFDQEIGEVFSSRVALVGGGKRGFRSGPDTSEAEFCEQSTLVDPFEESGAKRVGDFEHGAQHLLAESIEVCVIRVDLSHGSDLTETVIGSASMNEP